MPRAPSQPSYLAWSANEKVRHAASSGGFTRAMLAWLVRSGQVDCAVITRMRTPFVPETIATADVQEILAPECNSVYHMAPVLRVLQEIPEDRTSAVVALPCQVEAFRRGQQRGRFAGVRVIFELMCNQVPDAGREAWLCELFGVDRSEIARIAYRGKGWPGKTTIATRDGRTLELPSPRTWDNRRFLPRHCRACRRLSCGGDFLAGDPWGVTGHEIGPGKTLVVPRDAAAAELAAAAIAAGVIRAEPLTAQEAAGPLSRHKATKNHRTS